MSFVLPQELKDELKGLPGTLITIKCDLTKDDEVLSMFAMIKRDLGGVDVCVNNAGFCIPNDLLSRCTRMSAAQMLHSTGVTLMLVFCKVI